MGTASRHVRLYSGLLTLCPIVFSLYYIVRFYFWFSRPEAQGQPGSAEPLGMNLLLGFCRSLAGFGSLQLEDWRPCLLSGSLAHIPSHALHRASSRAGSSPSRTFLPAILSATSLPPAGARSLPMAISVSRALPILKYICQVSLAVEGHMFTGSRDWGTSEGPLCLPHLHGLACLGYMQSTFFS